MRFRHVLVQNHAATSADRVLQPVAKQTVLLKSGQRFACYASSQAQCHLIRSTGAAGPEADSAFCYILYEKQVSGRYVVTYEQEGQRGDFPADPPAMI